METYHMRLLPRAAAAGLTATMQTKATTRRSGDRIYRINRIYY
jgi:hypothetical protein